MTPWAGSLFATAGGGGSVPFASRSRGRRFCLHGGVTGPPSELAPSWRRGCSARSSASIDGDDENSSGGGVAKRCEWASHGWPSAHSAVGRSPGGWRSSCSIKSWASGDAARQHASSNEGRQRSASSADEKGKQP